MKPWSTLWAGALLVLGLCTRYAALGAASALAIAVYALHTVKGFGWLWNTGGYEYPIFWGAACLCVALWEFRRVYSDGSAVAAPDLHVEDALRFFDAGRARLGR